MVVGVATTQWAQLRARVFLWCGPFEDLEDTSLADASPNLPPVSLPPSALPPGFVLASLVPGSSRAST